ncbi:MAG TPA: response regulator [Bacteroidota bacterium]|nr:response regulator [Bacteroidota bacterium]
MVKSKLFWKVLANFGLLLVILTAMTILTLQVLSQIEGRFRVASSDTEVLANINLLRREIVNVDRAVDQYVARRSEEAKNVYRTSWQNFDVVQATVQKQLSDSLAYRMKQVRDLFFTWMEVIGDKKILLRDQATSDKQLNDGLLALSRLDAETQYLAIAREYLSEIAETKLASQRSSISLASGLSVELRNFVELVNILVALFALTLGFVLTRSITKPVALLKKGTKKMMEGNFEPIQLNRKDELGELAEDFNRMSVMLGNNYTRLKAYSELITTLNNLETLAEVETKSLQLLCVHTDSSVGALYILDQDQQVLNLSASYALKQRGKMVETMALGEGIPGECAAQQKILEVTNISEPTGFEISAGLVEIYPKAIIAVPVLFQDKLLGVMVLGSTKGFGEVEKDIINNSVPQIGVAIANAMNHEQTRRLSLEIAKRNEELNSKNAELEKAYRVKSDFLSSMSHELRTPLNSIIGFSSVLLGQTGDPLTPDQRMAIEKVLKNGKHLLELINDILDLSKLESGRMTVSVETEEVASVVSNCLMLTESLFRQKKLTVKEYVEPNLPKLSTDIVKVRQILMNLLSNAAKFTDQGEVAVNVTKRDGMIAFAVKDSGIGIKKEHYNIVFEEFRQVDGSNTRKYKGTGLGLPISRRLARMLGGDLVVESDYGKGSTFILTIPPVYVPAGDTVVYKKEEPKKKPVEQVAKEVSAAKAPASAQILCIDDDPDAIEILRKYLVPEGYSVASALSGDEGIKLALKLKPSLITLDIMMPQKDGWQVLRELKADARTKDIPVVVHSIIDNKPLAISLGAIDIIAKPTDPTRLLSLAKQYCKSSDQFLLVVDDNEDFAMAIERLLKEDGFTVKVAHDGKTALEVLRNSTPALILLDLVMPEMDGFGVVRELQQHPEWKKIPVVILSGKDLTETEWKQLNTHISDFVKKGSISHVELRQTIRKVLGQEKSVELAEVK